MRRKEASEGPVRVGGQACAVRRGVRNVLCQGCAVRCSVRRVLCQGCAVRYSSRPIGQAPTGAPACLPQLQLHQNLQSPTSLLTIVFSFLSHSTGTEYLPGQGKGAFRGTQLIDSWCMCTSRTAGVATCGGGRILELSLQAIRKA